MSSLLLGFVLWLVWMARHSPGGFSAQPCTHYGPVSMKNLWEVWTSALSDAECDNIISRAQTYPTHIGSIGDGKNYKTENRNIRSCDVRWLDRNAESEIVDRFMSFVRSSNRTNFGINIVSPFEIQFTEYYATDNGKYDWHHDVFFEADRSYNRKLTVVIQLSDPSEYEGGQFEFFSMPSPGEVFMPRGSLLIFPSFFNHRVLPVTKGVRRSLVSWIEGPRWQ
jgi:PKHD-type hydroxylase